MAEHMIMNSVWVDECLALNMNVLFSEFCVVVW
jgi:hypothetical protein